MSMLQYQTLNDMRNDLVVYAMNHQLTDDALRDSITGAISMDLVKIGGFIRFVYDMDDRDPELAQIAAAAAGVFTMSGFLEIGKNGTANGMRLAMLRDAGETAPAGLAWPDPENDPAKTPKALEEPATPLAGDPKPTE